MALSNRDRIQRGFEHLAAGLEPFVDEAMSAAAEGRDWVAMLEARDATKHGSAKRYSKADPQVQLKVITEDRRAFGRRLSRPEQAFASELREVRNRWAHHEGFTPDDTYRALDSMERLLTAAGAAEQADEVRKLRLDHQRAQYEADTRKAVKAAAAVSVPGTGIKPWREVITPHPDVAAGQYTHAEFAADLHYVAHGDAETDYVDPAQFFRRTYVTEGLRDLINRAARRLSGDMNASPVVNLQTNFGGGKTHSMLALYHLCSGLPLQSLPPEVQEALDGHDLAELGDIKRVTLVGNRLEPGKPSRKDDGTLVQTLWGELAWQLGGRPAYDRVAEADATKTNPGDSLSALITTYSPCLILIDEWVAYARQLYDRDDLPAGTFDTQFTFAQTLTEVVKTVPGALLVISIPASHTASGPDAESGASDEEVGGPNGQEALRRLQNVVRRVADQWRPATSHESFEIVRRRLFEEPDAEARRDIAAVARQFVQFYAEHRGEFPRESAQVAYEERIKAAYPVHPELFDRLYEDWSTLERFQRTRGVLRLVSSVVHALWAAGDAAPMILPGSVPLETPGVAGEITQYLPDQWKPIIDADIDGEGSTPVRIDRERPTFGKRSLTRRVARTIFMGSAATLHTAHKGVERQHVWLGVAIPGDTVGNLGSSVEVLSQRATYLHVDGTRYWYDTQASLTRTAQDLADRMRDYPETVWAELVRRMASERSARGDFAAVHTTPDDTADVPDTEDAKLVILHPQWIHGRGKEDSAGRRWAEQCFDRRGNAQRTNRNTVVFLAPDERRMEELADAVRDFLAWRQICDRVQELNLAPQQATQAMNRQNQADDTVGLRLASTYIWALVPVQGDAAKPATFEEIKADGAQDRLAERVTLKLRQNGLLTTVYGSRNVRLELDGPLHSAWKTGQISVGELWSYYCRYPYLTRLKNRSVLEAAIVSVLNEFTWQQEGFALAEGFEEADARYEGLRIPHEDTAPPITDATLLVAPDRALAQRAVEREAASVVGGQDGGNLTPVVDRPSPIGEALPPARPSQFFGVVALDPERYGRDFTRISQEVLQHLAAVPGAELEITLEVRANSKDGFADEKVRVVSENARTLKFDPFEFGAE